MAKHKPVVSDYEREIGTPHSILTKIPADITNGLTPSYDHMTIPCENIIEYQAKGDDDFTPWPEEKFQELVVSVREFGVIESITVRPSLTHPEKYELLAGEHRWKASKEAGKKSIPAHILRNCNDEYAAAIFSLTNLMRRELSLRDLIKGWHRCIKVTKILASSGNKENASNASKFINSISPRQGYRYASLNSLPEEVITAIEKKQLSIKAGENLSRLTESQMDLIAPYLSKIRKEEQTVIIRDWAKADSLDIEELESLLNGKAESTKRSIVEVARVAKLIARRRIPVDLYEDAESIFEEALDMYFSEYPERERQKPTRIRRSAKPN